MPVEMLKKLPKRAAAIWESTFQAAKSKFGEERAAKIAWTAVKKKFKKVGDKWVAKYEGSKVYTNVRYVFQADEASVSKSEDGTIYKDYVLSSNRTDKDNMAFGDFALKRMAEQINEEGVVGRLESRHSSWKELSEKGLTPEEIEEELQKAESGIKAIKATYKNGKLIAKVAMTPTAFEKAKSFNAASIEARFPAESLREGVVTQARLQGFVLTDTPSNPDAIAVS